MMLHIKRTLERGAVVAAPSPLLLAIEAQGQREKITHLRYMQRLF